jgi:hypothetical protein
MREKPCIAEALICEISRYLAAVEVFRAERCEPKWLPERAPCRTPEECVAAAAFHASPAH